ncbi:hypothetical protein PR048_027242 [Dryococelus australis]|uniref:Uncharacterized protein n=1 Tax=Dryococelus australis TaxID=614101 RepID=A0ABQ9GEW2_9NEOP|nr:hypothetical protein PR048_027242 [Dryococelus australis]
MPSKRIQWESAGGGWGVAMSPFPRFATPSTGCKGHEPSPDTPRPGSPDTASLSPDIVGIKQTVVKMIWREQPRSCLREPSSIPGRLTPGIFAGENRAGRCRWLPGFLGNLPFTQPLHSGVAPSPPHLTVIDAQARPRCGNSENPRRRRLIRLNIEVLRADEGETSLAWSGAGMQGRRETGDPRENPADRRHRATPAAGFEPGSRRWGGEQCNHYTTTGPPSSDVGRTSKTRGRAGHNDPAKWAGTRRRAGTPLTSTAAAVCEVVHTRARTSPASPHPIQTTAPGVKNFPFGFGRRRDRERERERERKGPLTAKAFLNPWLAAASFRRQEAVTPDSPTDIIQHLLLQPLVHAVFDISWRTLARSSPSTVTADNQGLTPLTPHQYTSTPARRTARLLAGVTAPPPPVGEADKCRGEYLAEAIWLTVNSRADDGGILRDDGGRGVRGVNGREGPASLPPRFNPRPGHTGFSDVGIVLDDAVGLRFFSVISRFSRPFIQALLYTHLSHPLSALKTSLLRAVQISSLKTRTLRIHDFDDLLARLYSLMFKFGDIYCTFAVCCNSGRRRLDQPSLGVCQIACGLRFINTRVWKSILSRKEFTNFPGL